MLELPTIPMRDGDMLTKSLIGLYMAHYDGRDTTRLQRLSWWITQIGDTAIRDVNDDHIHAAIEALSKKNARYFAGNDADDNPIYKAKRKPLSPATLNRYAASIAAVFTWAVKKRIVPKGWIHPCRSMERRAENNEQTRFLSDAERGRLLTACRGARWPGLYALVLLALTTGGRKSELTGLHWNDLDMARGIAHVGTTKNGDPKVLPLVPNVVAAINLLPVTAPDHLVFRSKRDHTKPFAFEPLFAQALNDAKIQKFRFHDLRHSCASMLAQNGATLLEIADLLGHRQLQVTKRYAHLASGHKAALVNRVLGAIA